MLAMIAMLVLQTEHATVIPPSLSRKKEAASIIPLPPRSGNDYFSLTKSLALSNPVSPVWPRLSSPTTSTHTPAVSTSNSSRGSWSSLFNTGSVRQFMSGVQDTFKEGLATPGETPAYSMHDTTRAEKMITRLPDSPGTAAARRRRVRKDSWYAPVPVPVSRSWNESLAGDGKRLSGSLGAGPKQQQHHQGSLRLADGGVFGHERKVVVFQPPAYEETCVALLFAQCLLSMWC